MTVGTMAPANAVLTTGEYIVNDEVLLSSNGVFKARLQSDGNLCVGEPGMDLWCALTKGDPGGPYFLLMQNDGNLVIYSGTGPADNRGAVWAAGVEGHSPTGAYYVVMQDDGNLVIYQGVPGDGQDDVLWATNTTDPVVAVGDIQSISYDLDAGVINASEPDQDLGPNATLDVQNTRGTTQHEKITLTAETKTTSAWSDTLKVSVSVQTDFKCDVPFVASGKIQTTITAENDYTWNGSTEHSQSIKFEEDVKVPAHETMKVSLIATRSTITVPYVVAATLTFKSGRKALGQVSGVYQGVNSHDFTVNYS